MTPTCELRHNPDDKFEIRPKTRYLNWDNVSDQGYDLDTST